MNPTFASIRLAVQIIESQRKVDAAEQDADITGDYDPVHSAVAEQGRLLESLAFRSGLTKDQAWGHAVRIAPLAKTEAFIRFSTSYA